MGIRDQLNPYPSFFPAAPSNLLTLLIDGSTATAALVDPTASNDPPTTGTVWVGNSEAAVLVFGGTDAANKIVNYQVILWRMATNANNDAFVPEVVASGTFTLGADVYAATNLDGAGTNLWADTITETIIMPGVLAYSPANDTRASLEIPTRGAAYLQVETDLNDAVTADVFVQLGQLTNELAHLSRGAGGSGATVLRTVKAVVGNPTYGFDAAPVDDTYQTVMTTPNDGKYRHNISMRCDTKDMIVSLDAGTTDHFYCVAGDKPTWYSDLYIAPNTAIQAKNAAAGQNYANAAISIW